MILRKISRTLTITNSLLVRFDNLPKKMPSHSSQLIPSSERKECQNESAVTKHMFIHPLPKRESNTGLTIENMAKSQQVTAQAANCHHFGQKLNEINVMAHNLWVIIIYLAGLYGA